MTSLTVDEKVNLTKTELRLKKSVQSLQEQLEAAHRNAAEADSQLRAIQADLEREQATGAQLNDTIVKMRALNEQVIAQLKEKKAACEQLKTQLEEAQRTLETVRETLAARDRQLEDEEARHTAQVGELNARIHELQAKIDESCDAMARSKEQADSRIVCLEQDVNALAAELEEARAAAQAASNRANELEAVVAEKATHVATLESVTEQQRLELERTNKQVDTLRADLAAADNHIMQSGGALERATAELESTKRDLEEASEGKEKSRQLRAHIARLKAEVKQLRAELTEERLITAAGAGHRNHRQRIKQHLNVKRENEELQTANADLRDTICALHAQIDELQEAAAAAAAQQEQPQQAEGLKKKRKKWFPAGGDGKPSKSRKVQPAVASGQENDNEEDDATPPIRRRLRPRNVNRTANPNNNVAANAIFSSPR